MNAPERKWPFTLPRNHPVHMSLQLVGDLTFDEYFTSPFKWHLRNCKAKIEQAIQLVTQHHGNTLPSKNNFHRLMDLIACDCDDVTIKVLVTKKPCEWHECEAQGKRLHENLKLLDQWGVGMTCLRMDNNDRKKAKHLFDCEDLLTHLGYMRIRDYFSTFDSLKAYKNAYTEKELELFEKLRYSGIFGCKTDDYVTFECESSEASRHFLVNNECWNETLEMCVEDQPGQNCDGGPGPSTDICP